jgi:hypothetical protein
MKKLITLSVVLGLLVSLTGMALCQTPKAEQTKTPAAKTEAVKTAKPAPVKLSTFTGLVTAVDVVANTITVKKAKTEETFTVDPTATIKYKKDYKLGDVPKDSKVVVKYKLDGAKKTASSILIVRLPKVAKTVAAKTPAAK